MPKPRRVGGCHSLAGWGFRVGPGPPVKCAHGLGLSSALSWWPRDGCWVSQAARSNLNVGSLFCVGIASNVDSIRLSVSGSLGSVHMSIRCLPGVYTRACHMTTKHIIMMMSTTSTFMFEVYHCTCLSRIDTCPIHTCIYSTRVNFAFTRVLGQGSNDGLLRCVLVGAGALRVGALHGKSRW